MVENKREPDWKNTESDEMEGGFREKEGVGFGRKK
jgi:hypothetical protein